MKKILFSFLIFTLYLNNMSGQQTTDSLKIRKNIIKTDIAELLLTTVYHLNVSWEHLMRKKTSLDLNYYITKNKNELGFSNFTMGIKAGYRFYFNKNANQMKGYYLAPFVQMDWIHYRNDYFYIIDGYYSAEYDDFTPFAGLQTGYQFMLNKNWILDLNIRLGVDLDGAVFAYADRSYLGIGLQIGHKF